MNEQSIGLFSLSFYNVFHKVYYSTHKNHSRSVCTMNFIKHNRLEATGLFAIQR